MIWTALSSAVGVIVGIGVELRKVWQPKAVIQLAQLIGQLSEADYQWLDREIS